LYWKLLLRPLPVHENTGSFDYAESFAMRTIQLRSG
jgi:hypothetical protein